MNLQMMISALNILLFSNKTFEIIINSNKLIIINLLLLFIKPKIYTKRFLTTNIYNFNIKF